jgi:protein-S-isoprenylcysteine O-methyltransferase Ste14
LGEDVVKESSQKEPVTGKRNSKPVLPILTDLIFITTAAYLLLSYARTFLTQELTPLLVVRETFFAAYLLMAFILLAVRNRATAFTGNKADYAYTILGFTSPLFFQISPYAGPFVLAASLEFIGLVFVVSAFTSLNRSFGLAPENRGIKTGGVYRIVRHPMYLGYILAEAGYLIENSSTLNVFIFLVSALFLLLRLRAEERLLQQDQAYRSYARKTRWRLLPLVY